MQGQSGYTWFKEERFAAILVQSLRISKARNVRTYPYYHIDLNAGSGYNTEAGVPGSPVNFLNAVARERRDNMYAFFIDKDPSCIAALTTCPEILATPKDRLSVFEADNAELLPVVSAFIRKREHRPQYAMGSILIDPNGYSKGVPWDALRMFCAEYRRFDVIMNLNIRTLRLETGHAWGRDRVHWPSEFSALFSRPSWMWTDVCQIAGSSWMQFVGRTIQTDTIGYSQLGFYDSRSARAQAILAKVEPAASTAHPTLLFDL